MSGWVRDRFTIRDRKLVEISPTKKGRFLLTNLQKYRGDITNPGDPKYQQHIPSVGGLKHLRFSMATRPSPPDRGSNVWWMSWKIRCCRFPIGARGGKGGGWWMRQEDDDFSKHGDGENLFFRQLRWMDSFFCLEDGGFLQKNTPSFYLNRIGTSTNWTGGFLFWG